MAAPSLEKNLIVDEDYDGNPETITRVTVHCNECNKDADITYTYLGDIDPETKRSEIEADLQVRGFSWSE
jgi:hypothetical protein